MATKHDTILVVSGVSDTRDELCAIFEEEYNILEAANLSQGRLLLERTHEYIAAVLLDITDYGEAEMEELRETGKKLDVRNTPLLLLTISCDETSVQKMLERGVADVIEMPCYPALLQHRVHRIIESNALRFHTQQRIAEKVDELAVSYERIIDLLATGMETHSTKHENHLACVRYYTSMLLQELAKNYPEYDLDAKKIQLISSASSLHDIGKVIVPVEILDKPSPLSEVECKIMQRHAMAGCQMLDTLEGAVDPQYLEYARQICHYHHERWDGKGYPEGLSGNDIPLCAQVVGLADAYDALVSYRADRSAYPLDHAANMILRGECGAFSPSILECFKNLVGNFIEFSIQNPDDVSAVNMPSHPLQTRRAEENMFDLVQSKYQSLLQHLNASVFEFDLDHFTYHVAFNADVNFRWVNQMETYDAVREFLFNQLIVPEERETIKELARRKIKILYDYHLRREQLYLHIVNMSGGDPLTYRVTMFPILSKNSDRKRVFVIWENMEGCLQTNADGGISEKRCPRQEALEDMVDRMYTICNDEKLTLERPSKDMLMFLGYTPQELDEACGNHLIELVHPDDRDRLRTDLAVQLQKGDEAIAEFRVLHKNGSYIWVLSHVRLTLQEDGREVLYSLLLDISNNKKVEELLQQTIECQSIILEQTENVIFEYDIDTDMAIFSNKWDEMFGYPPRTENFYNHMMTESHIHPEDVLLMEKAFREIIGGRSHYESFDIRVAKNDGHYLWCRTRITAQLNREGRPVRMIGVMINVDAEKKEARTLLEQAEHDPLSGLLNKIVGRGQVEKFLNGADPTRRAALIAIDLDNFKQVNDRYGHLSGDAMITAAAIEIKKLFRANDVVARMGGDAGGGGGSALRALCAAADTALPRGNCRGSHREL